MKLPRSLANLPVTALLALGALAAALLGAVWLHDSGPTRPIAGRLELAVVTPGPANDSGWSATHAQALSELEARMGPTVRAHLRPSVPESAEVARTIEELLAAKVRLIFLASYGYKDWTASEAASHPGVAFVQVSGTTHGANLGCYAPRTIEAMYVCGYVAGRMTRTGRLGFLAAHPIPQVIANINAFTLGVRSACPAAVVQVIWLNSWSDPAAEAPAVHGLAELRTDVIAHHLSSSATVVAEAQARGIYCIGYNTDLSRTAAACWLTGVQFRWATYYEQVARGLIAGTWRGGSDRLGLDSGVVALAPFGPRVSKELRSTAAALLNRIRSGAMQVFTGPLADRSGRLRLEPGVSPAPGWLEGMDWFVPGVSGPLPSANVFESGVLPAS